jgi:hypothetical protein
MGMLQIDVSDDLRSQLELRAAQGGFGTVEQYAEAVLRESVGADSTDDRHDGPAHLKLRAPADLAAKLREGIDSGPAAAKTDADWDEMRRRLQAQVAGKSGQ